LSCHPDTDVDGISDNFQVARQRHAIPTGAQSQVRARLLSALLICLNQAMETQIVCCFIARACRVLLDVIENGCNFIAWEIQMQRWNARGFGLTSHEFHRRRLWIKIPAFPD